MKILFIEENAAPYRDETYSYLLKTGQDVVVFTEYRPGSKDNHNEWEYKSIVEEKRIYCKSVKRNIFGSYRCGFWKIVKDNNPNVVCSSSLREIIVTKVFFRKRTIYRTDNIKSNAIIHNRFKKFVLKILLKIPDCFWVPGNASYNFYSNVVKVKQKIYYGAYTYDADRIFTSYNNYLLQKDEIRIKLGIKTSDIVFLFVGKLIPSRHIEHLLDLAKKMSVNKELKFLICGDGPQKNLIVNSSEKKNIIYLERITLNKLEQLYAISDIYIHPGEEPYSLALYEAAICGLPIVASDKVGATFDCLQNKYNGLLFEYCDIDDMHKKVTNILNNLSNFVSNSKVISNYIIKERGTKWAANQLLMACGENGK